MSQVRVIKKEGGDLMVDLPGGPRFLHMGMGNDRGETLVAFSWSDGGRSRKPFRVKDKRVEVAEWAIFFPLEVSKG